MSHEALDPSMCIQIGSVLQLWSRKIDEVVLLQEVSVRFQTVEEGGDLCWADLGISVQEAAVLAHAITAAPKITTFRLVVSVFSKITYHAGENFSPYNKTDIHYCI